MNSVLVVAGSTAKRGPATKKIALLSPIYATVTVAAALNNHAFELGTVDAAVVVISARRDITSPRYATAGG